MYRVTFPTYYFLPSILLTLQRPFLLFVVLEIYAPFSSPSASKAPPSSPSPQKIYVEEEGGGESHFTRKKKEEEDSHPPPFLRSESECEKPQK